MGAAEFVAFVAIGLVVGATSIDLMLPALRAIGDDFALETANRSQAVIAVFLLGVGPAQLLFGPLSDRYGRRRLFLAGVLIFLLGATLSALAPAFHPLLFGRLLQGFGAGAVRVVTFSIVRDRHSGPQLAHVMSLAMTVVLLEPIVAPLFGQVILLFASWRWIVAAMAGVGAATLAWAWWRLDESLPARQRRSMSPTSLAAAYRMFVTTPPSVAGTLVCGLVMGAHLGFLSSAQGIFEVVFDEAGRFTLWLALVSLAMSAAAFANARLVRRYGTSRLIRSALYALAAVNSVALAIAVAAGMSLPVFLAIQACNMFAFGLLLPNLTTMAMNPLGSIAGTASSIFGFVSTTIAAGAAFVVGQCFDGTVRPVAGAYVLISAAALLILSHYGKER